MLAREVRSSERVGLEIGLDGEKRPGGGGGAMSAAWAGKGGLLCGMMCGEGARLGVRRWEGNEGKNFFPFWPLRAKRRSMLCFWKWV